MVRTVLANKNHEIYLQKCALEHQFSYGLIIGQPSKAQTDYIVHLAKNLDNTDHDEVVDENAGEQQQVKHLGDVNSQLLLNHVISATKMIPGSFYVLGIFIVDDHDIFDNKAEVDKARQLLNEINTVLKANKYLRGFSSALPNGEKMLISYCSSSKTCSCRTIGNFKINGEFTPNKILFLENPTSWYMFETNYEMDNVFPIVEKNKKINIEHHFGITLENIIEYLESSEVFVQNEPIEDEVTLEVFIREKLNPVNISQDNEHLSFKVCLFLPAIASSKDPIVIEKFQGMIRFSGIIASRIWTHSFNNLGDIATFIRNDIIRSLSSRIQIYCDGLIDQYASLDAVVISEPPRRVFYNVPNGDGIQFCEYIFRGETPSVAAAQAKDLLDLIIDPSTIDPDLEGMPADEESLATVSSQHIIKTKTVGMSYMIGLLIAISILLCSIALHFILQ